MCLCLTKKSYSVYYVKFVNNTTKEIHAQVDHILYVRNFDRAPVFETAKNKKILPQKWYYLRNHDYIFLENKYRIEIKELEIPCSWVHIFNYIKHVHGVGLEIIINNKNKGVICANKRNIVDYCYNAMLSFENVAGHEQLRFFNTGWWQNDSVYPIFLELKL